MTVLIPAYEPDERLLELILNIKNICNFNILIVDDGSGKRYDKIFRSAEGYGCKVLTHQKNKGKGQALKTGFEYIKETGENEGVVCADCDGQHRPEDIVRIAGRIKDKLQIILGSRRFIGRVPLRSRFGNSVTRNVFSFATEIKIFDTQTGLRGYPAGMLDWLCSIKGERFEYEMNILLEAPSSGYSFYEVDIDTVYYKNNKSSHFHTVKDSIRVYLPILKFSASSILSAVLDWTLLVLLQLVTSSLLFAVAGARVCSSIFNYTLNKNYVFSGRKEITARESVLKYFTLVVIVMAFNYGLIFTFNKLLLIPLFFAKLLAEAAIFLFSYWSQHRYIFAGRQI